MHSYNVLIVEDNPEDRASYRRLLGDNGAERFTFVETGSGLEGLRAYHAQRPDCVLLGDHLPDHEGLELLREMVGPTGSRTAVIVLTGRGDEAIAVRAMKAGAQDYLVKDRLSGSELTRAIEVAVERVRLLRRIEQGQERFRLAVEASPSAMLMVDQPGAILLANRQAERLFGYTREELLDRSVEELVPPRYRENHPTFRLDFLSAPAARPMGAGRDLFAIHRSGREIPVEVGLTPIQTEEGLLVLCSIVDITERKRAEEERRALEGKLQQAQRLESLGLLAGGMAHRFNNLMVGVLGNSSLALMELPPGAPVRERLEEIDRAAQRAADLGRQILALSGKGQVAVEPLDLSALAEEMRPGLTALMPPGAALDFRLTSGLPHAAVDTGQLRQVISNLVANAAEALGPAGGEVMLTTGATRLTPEGLAASLHAEGAAEGDYVFVEVADSGRGMDANTLGKAFDPFFTTKFTGRGLGLAAVQAIVRGHRGVIQAMSVPGAGTVFRMLLPVLRAEAQRPQPAREPPAEQRTVLVVDDEEMVRKVAQAMLRASGFHVLAAPDGAAALKLFAERQADIDLVLLDLTMPGMSGEELCVELRKLRPDVRVLLTSGYTEEQAADVLERSGAVGFLQKPWLGSTMVSRIRAALPR